MIRDVVVGRLRDGADEDACRAYDADEEHDRVRRELFGPICAEIARVQLRA